MISHHQIFVGFRKAFCFKAGILPAFSSSKSKPKYFQELPGNLFSGEIVNKEYFEFGLKPEVNVIHLNSYKYGLNKGYLVNIL